MSIILDYFWSRWEKVKESWADWNAKYTEIRYPYGQIFDGHVSSALEEMKAKKNGERYTIPGEDVNVILNPLDPGVITIQGKEGRVKRIHSFLEKIIENAKASPAKVHVNIEA